MFASLTPARKHGINRPVPTRNSFKAPRLLPPAKIKSVVKMNTPRYINVVSQLSLDSLKPFRLYAIHSSS